MSERYSHNWQPTPEDFAAYVDGRLDGWRHRELEAWLARHPEMTAELEGHHRLARLWRRCDPANPSHKRWSALRKCIFAYSDNGDARNAHWHWWFGPIVLGAVAASALFGMVFFRGTWPFSPGGQPGDPGSLTLPRVIEGGKTALRSNDPLNDEPLNVVTPDEVEIITIDMRDSKAILIGQLPLLGNLALLTEDDVDAITVKADDPQGSTLEFKVESPMIWLPRALER